MWAVIKEMPDTIWVVCCYLTVIRAPKKNCERTVLGDLWHNHLWQRLEEGCHEQVLGVGFSPFLSVLSHFGPVAPVLSLFWATLAQWPLSLVSVLSHFGPVVMLQAGKQVVALGSSQLCRIIQMVALGTVLSLHLPPHPPQGFPSPPAPRVHNWALNNFERNKWFS